MRKGRKGLLRVGGTGTGRTAQFFECFDCLLTLLAQVRVDRMLGLRLAMLGAEAPPALRHPTRGGRHDTIAITVQQGGHRVRVRLGEGGVRVAHGRGAPGDPLHASPRELLQIILTIEGTISHQRGGAGGRLHLRNGCLDDLAELGPITALAAQWWHAHGKPRVRLDHSGQHDWLAVGPMLPTIAARAVHDLCVGGIVAVVAAIDMATGAIEMREARDTPQTLGGRGRNETVECGNAIIIARISRPAEGVIMEMLRFDHQGGQESRGRFVLEQPLHPRAVLVHTAEAVQDHGFDGIARGHDPRCWLVSGRAVHDLTYAEGIEHTRDKAPMVEELTPIGVWHGVLLSRGDSTDP